MGKKGCDAAVWHADSNDQPFFLNALDVQVSVVKIAKSNFFHFDKHEKK